MKTIAARIRCKNETRIREFGINNPVCLCQDVKEYIKTSWLPYMRANKDNIRKMHKFDVFFDNDAFEFRAYIADDDALDTVVLVKSK